MSGEGETSSEARRKASEISVDEYLWAAEQTGALKGMARYLSVPYSSMHKDLHRRGIFAHVMNLLPEVGKPGARNVPPMPTVEGAGSDVEIDVEAIKESARKRYELKARRAQEKENQHIRFAHGPVAIFIVSDQHLGNQGTDVGRVFEEQRMILSTPGSFVWQAGDVVDAFIVGRLIAENFKPSLPVFEQWELGRHYLENFKDKLVAVVSGNHDQWHTRLTGIDFAREITPHGALYDADEIRATIHVGNANYRIVSRHKVRGNSMYNPTHGLERMARFDSPNTDIFCGAHVHRGAVAREFTLEGRRKIALMSGSYKVIDSFAREVGFERHDSSTAVALVLEDDGSFWGTSNIPSVVKYMNTVYHSAA